MNEYYERIKKDLDFIYGELEKSKKESMCRKVIIQGYYKCIYGENAVHSPDKDLEAYKLLKTVFQRKKEDGEQLKIPVTEEDIRKCLGWISGPTTDKTREEDANSVMIMLRKRGILSETELSNERDKLQKEVQQLRKNYLDVVDSICRESTGPEDVIRQVHDLRAKLAMAETEMERQGDRANDAENVNSKLRKKNHALAESLAKHQVKICPKVRFECTVDDVCEHIGYKSQFALAAINKAMDYLSAHAVVEVPDGVPSIDDLCSEYIGKGKIDSPIQFIYNRLAPYLRPSAVDPKLCETPFYSEISVSSTVWSKSDGIRYRLKDEIPPELARDTGLWLLSFAVAHGVDVRLPDIATAETLEQLAEIGQKTLYPRQIDCTWDQLTPDQQQRWYNTVTAILRAAKPNINILSGELSSILTKGLSCHEIVKALDQYIRYRVELPEDES